MTTAIDPAIHQHLKIDTTFDERFGDNRHIIDVLPNEFRSVSAYYPILISKDAKTGEYIFVSLFGFAPGENLYLEGQNWDANYVPLNMIRGPFSVDFKDAPEQGAGKIPVLCIQEDHPRVGKDTGEALFSNGQASPYLLKMQTAIKQMLEGFQMTRALAGKMNEYGLIEPMNIELTFCDNSKQSLAGLYSINENKLANLSDSQVLDLYKHKLLEPLYAMLASLSQLGGLVKRKNNRLQGK